jgi:acyl-coenzyme A synthetase/AMP-(fatty) acid ligase
MYTSNEPGFYKTGEYGIRIENLVLCVEAEETEYGQFLQFETMTLFPEKLVGFIEEQRVTTWKGVSSLLMYMARAGVLRPGRMPALRQILFAGEVLPTRYLVEWMTSFPDKIFYNAYGPTEATGVSICYRVESIPDATDTSIPIGRPRDGTRVLLLDENHSEVAPGNIGEICLAGAGLARGYLSDEAKTSESFVQVPQVRIGDRVYLTGDLGRLRPDGNLEYVGRKDRQLKFLGYRIEAGEVEKALMTIPDIKDTAVHLVESKLTTGMMELVAYWEADAEIDVPFVSDELKKLLPPYMIPKRFIRVDKMPRCSRGKLDLSALTDQNRMI